MGKKGKERETNKQGNRARTKRTGREPEEGRERKGEGKRRGRKIEARGLKVGSRWWKDQSTVYNVQRTETSERRRMGAKHVCMYICECMKVSM